MKSVAKVAPRPLPCRLSLSELHVRLADWTREAQGHFHFHPHKTPTSVSTAAILKRYLHPVLGHSARTRYLDFMAQQTHTRFILFLLIDVWPGQREPFPRFWRSCSICTEQKLQTRSTNILAS